MKILFFILQIDDLHPSHPGVRAALKRSGSLDSLTEVQSIPESTLTAYSHVTKNLQTDLDKLQKAHERITRLEVLLDVRNSCTFNCFFFSCLHTLHSTCTARSQYLAEYHNILTRDNEIPICQCHSLVPAMPFMVLTVQFLPFANNLGSTIANIYVIKNVRGQLLLVL